MTTDQLRELAEKKREEHMEIYKDRPCSPDNICKHDVSSAHHIGASLFLEPLMVAMVALESLENSTIISVTPITTDVCIRNGVASTAREALSKIAALLEK